ncbi:hypothetical protein DFO70_112194 [Cytobacillus firmus]|uniref:DUF3953 domain-containing protein n=2 Tax=Cytobacillus TaxID=2675230 RepID=A0A366JMQ6_CYTFI|nr:MULTISPECIES: hypothetical protein [Cytobacillus]RBP89157.1 hypothetical protein DFO70_112194 [Cytobacillus firmus]TDX46990.1 hypothetical protein DFO72_10173 [Cytobacillus oceanisediminis]
MSESIIIAEKRASIVQKITLFGIILLIIPSALNPMYMNLVFLLLGINFIFKGFVHRAKENRKDYYFFLFGGLCIILVGILNAIGIL